MRAVVDAVLARSPAQPLFLWRAARRLTVLAYHAVDDPDPFSRHLTLLRRAAHVVSVDDVVSAVTGRRGLPSRAVLLTFDDGDRSVFEAGLPLLAEYGMPGVAFVIAGLVGTDRPPWWVEVTELMAAGGRWDGDSDPRVAVRRLKDLPDERRRAAIDRLRATARRAARPAPQLCVPELRELEAAGIAVGNHTVTHPILPRCRDADVRSEIEEAHRRLARWLGHAPTSFAYPNGDWDARAAAVLRELGCPVAFVFDHGLSPVPPPDPLRISRVRVNASTPRDRFRLLVSGLHPAVHRLLGRC